MVYLPPGFARSSKGAVGNGSASRVWKGETALIMLLLFGISFVRMPFLLRIILARDNGYPMKKYVMLLVLAFLAAAGMLLASCAKSNITSTALPQTSLNAAVLTVTGGNQTKTYSLADLQALPAVSGYGGQIRQGNTIAGPDSYQGVALKTLLDAVGGMSAGQNVKITGSDNYSQNLSYEQVTADNFTLFDSVTGQESAAAEMMPEVFIAYEKNGSLLTADTGPFEFGIITCQKRVTQGTLWVKHTARIEVMASQ
jgi:Oxidoreductase molybdopterin binding domain